MSENVYYKLFWKAHASKDPYGWWWRLCAVVMFLRTAGKHWSRGNYQEARSNLRTAKTMLLTGSTYGT